MVRSLFLILILITTFERVKGQDLSSDLKKYAVKFNKVDSLSSDVYDLLAAYQLIMIGEIHGTNEPVNLLEGLVNLLTKYGDSVQVGFEIPSRQMTYFLNQRTERTDKRILKTEFFSNPSGDGRASIAWYKAIANLNKNKKVKIFFFDKNFDQFGDADSIMYLNIKSQIKEHPNRKTITICGDMHNRLVSDNGQNTIGTLLAKDRELNITDSICSLNHFFKGGQTLWNKFEETESAYSKLGYENYVFLYPKNYNESYIGFFYTKYLTKSESAVSK